MNCVVFVFNPAQFFGLIPKASLSELEVAGHHYCEDDWQTLKTKHSEVDDLDLLRHCFSAAHIVALLHDGLGIPMNDTRYCFSMSCWGLALRHCSCYYSGLLEKMGAFYNF